MLSSGAFDEVGTVGKSHALSTCIQLEGARGQQQRGASVEQSDTFAPASMSIFRPTASPLKQHLVCILPSMWQRIVLEKAPKDGRAWLELTKVTASTPSCPQRGGFRDSISCTRHARTSVNDVYIHRTELSCLGSSAKQVAGSSAWRHLAGSAP